MDVLFPHQELSTFPKQVQFCGAPVQLRKRRMVQAAAGTQRWVPRQAAEDAAAVVRAAQAAGYWTVVAELTAGSVSLAALQPRFPSVIVLGGETLGVFADVLACADQLVAIPMLGMANSLNVATASGIVLHELARVFQQAGSVDGTHYYANGAGP